MQIMCYSAYTHSNLFTLQHAPIHIQAMVNISYELNNYKWRETMYEFIEITYQYHAERMSFSFVFPVYSI